MEQSGESGIMRHNECREPKRTKATLLLSSNSLREVLKVIVLLRAVGPDGILDNIQDAGNRFFLAKLGREALLQLGKNLGAVSSFKALESASSTRDFDQRHEGCGVSL